MAREGQWSEAIAVGDLNFVEKVKSELGSKAAHRQAIERGGTYSLREQSEAYGSDFTGENEVLSSGNTRIWNEDSELRRFRLVRPRCAKRVAALLRLRHRQDP